MPILDSTGWFVLFVFFFFTVAIGVVLRERVKTSLDFQLAGRLMPLWVGVVSCALSGLSAIEFLAMGAAGALYGWAAAGLFALGSAAAMLLAGVFLAPRLRQSATRSLSAYLGTHFGSTVRRVHAALLVAVTLLTASLSLTIFARLVQSMRLLDIYFYARQWPLGSIFPATVLFAAALAALYVLLGGMAATMANHVLQALVLVAGVLPALWFGLHRLGGRNGLRTALAQTGASAPHPAALFFLAGLVLGAIFWCADGRALQSILSARNSAAAKKTLLFATPVRLLLMLLFVAAGVVATALPTPRSFSSSKVVNGAIYRETFVVPRDAAEGRGLVPAQTDATGAPLHDAAGRPQLDGGRAIPTLLARVLPAKVRGLGLAALLAALLCGLAASLSALGTTFVNDLYEPRSDAALEKKQDAIQAEMKKLALCRWTTGGAAALVAALACAWSLAPAVRTQNVFPLLLILLAVAGVPSLVAVLLGLFTRTKPQPKNAEA